MCLFRNAEQNKNMQAYFVLRSTCTTFVVEMSHIVGHRNEQNN